MAEPALSFDSSAITFRRPGLARRLSRASAAALIAPTVTTAALLVLAWNFDVELTPFGNKPFEIPLGHIFATPWLTKLIAASILSVVLAAPALALFSAIVGALARTRGGRIEVDAGGIRVTRGRRTSRIAARDVVAGLVVPTATDLAMELHLCDGRVLHATIESEREAHAALGLLGVGPERRRVAVAMGSEILPLVAGGAAFVPTTLGALWVILKQYLDPAWSFVPVWLFGPIVLMVAVIPVLARRLAQPPWVTVGADGVLVKRVMRSRLLPYAEIERVFAEGGRLFIEARGAELDRIEVRGKDAALAAGLVERIREGIAAGHRAGSALAAAKLDPQGRPFAEWRAALENLLQRGADYRDAPVVADELLAVLGDAAAPPPRRIGAALALRSSDLAEVRARVQVAAAACADEEVGAALEAAAQEEIDEGPIRRVIGVR